ncbi:ATP-dependent DNA helicase RecG [Candidatus Daviesbacteria bacterium]|nr:ATP-dependent DNA helicase RecG [Candidatus Daviesbacteria bacterium]
MNLDTKLTHILGIGPTLAWRLEKLELLTVEDLINHYPFRYDDFSNISTTLDAKVGEKVTLVGEIWSIKNIYTRSRKILTQAIFNDGNSPIELTWFNQSWLTKNILVGDKLQISGKVSKYKNKLSIMAPVWEKLTDKLPTTHNSSLHTGRLVPVYPETFGLTSKWLRQKIASFLPQVLKEIQDPLPESIKDSMLNLADALNKIHFPQNYNDVDLAKQRLGFDELFYIQLATLKTRKNWQKKQVLEPLKINSKNLREFIKSLPFKLTSAQLKVIDEIIKDLQKDFPMNRLVQGEVGSGKTVVAAAICYLIFQNNLKSFFMAPTEILAFQHFSTLKNLLEPFNLKVGIYTGSKKKAQEADVIVGTHALLSKKLLPENIGLIVVDEQQRFGVEQRSFLRSKAKIPHFLTMTATPIPRTVALTLYGDLDLSIIDEMPKGRKIVKTFVVPNKKRLDSYKFIEKKVKAGDQVYIITPFIEPSETQTSVKAAKIEFENLKKVFPKLKLGLLHGRLKSSEKELAINDFKDGKTDILVSTSVVEVGVDVANATIMIVEGAERFGLAQLHQLRGRVGRGEKESFCFLFAENENSSVLNRLKNLERTQNGLELAELDLKIRGSGEIFGTAQSGRFNLKIASFSDLTLLEQTRNKAGQILKEDVSLDKYPLLKAKLAEISQEVMPD